MTLAPPLRRRNDRRYVSSPIDDMVALRRAVLRRCPEYDVDSDDALRALRDEAQSAAADAEALCALDGRAVVMLWTIKSRVGWESQRARVELALDDAGATAWVGEQLRQLRPRFAPSLELLLDAAHAALLPHAEAAGLVPRLKLLHGSPSRALAGLRAGGLDPDALGDLAIVPLEHAHIEDVVTLYADVFGELPELGMLPPRVQLTDALQRSLDDFVRNTQRRCVEAQTAYAVLHDGELLGHGAAQTRSDALMGLVGGFSIALRPALRGRGIGKLLYERLIGRLVSLGVAVMRGRTANPAVLHLAERMGRPVRAWQLELAPPSASTR